METMTYRDVIVMRRNLDQVNPLEGTNAKFLYAVSKNKAKLDSIIKHLDNTKKPSDEMVKYWEKLDEINKKFAETDESGTVLYTNISVEGQTRKAYKKVVGEGNPDSKYTKEIEKLKEKFRADLDKYEAAIKKYNELLEEEVEEFKTGEKRFHMIDLEIVPSGLNPLAMDGCLPFIKDQEDKEPEKEKKDDKPK